jgi:hypothetical protein
MAPKDYRTHEVNFCSEVSKWADSWFQGHSDLPFASSEIETFTRGSNKRSDLRVFERPTKQTGRGKLALTGEVKLPGTPFGRSPFDPVLLLDAFNKATAENCRYFFTWNVEEFALFDRSIWNAASMHERCVGHWKLGLTLKTPTDVSRPDVQRRLFSDFLPQVIEGIAEVFLGKTRGPFTVAPSQFYITVLESHLTGPLGPVRELRDFLASRCEEDKLFDSKLRFWMVSLQWNFDRKDVDSWNDAVDRAAHSMVYVLSNRILFYQAVRLRNHLPELRIPRSAKTPESALKYLKGCFEEAVEMTGDYEPVFFPDEDENEWAALAALSGVNSLEAWQKVIEAVEKFEFKEIPTDILGGVFQKLISPEERHRFGQHYTDENIVDVINAFCIRKADDVVLDPACGSGSFLVRAYYRKSQLGRQPDHHELLQELYGCDINPFPAHLATLNLAARRIANEENYPRIARKNFFLIRRDSPEFCELPKAARDKSGRRERERIDLPELDAVIGNPPYVRHELIPKAKERGVVRDQTKEYISHAAELTFKGLELSRQSDLHLYFWPVAAQFLKEGGWFGFLTSSSWLDVRYGFELQRWILENFRLVAVMESTDEPWFEDARVKTAVTILERCSDPEKRNSNLVRFVRFKQPLATILGDREDEAQKQESADRLRDLILTTKWDYSSNALRILVKKQSVLWQEGIALGEMFARQKEIVSAAVEEDDYAVEESEESQEYGEEGVEAAQTEVGQRELHQGGYGGGKWGRYLRAPDFYFEIMREFGDRFTRLGEIASIRFGIKSGCDAFFMPREVSQRLLEDHDSEMEWQSLPLMQRCRRADVKSGKLVIIEAGDKTLHPIERKFVRPEVHSLMKVNRPIVRAEDLDRVVLWVDRALEQIKGTYAYEYIRWGSKQTFPSKKSKPVPVPKRPTCVSRELWYNLTGLKPGIAFWPMAQQYRHIIAANPTKLNCNHNLFDLHLIDGAFTEQTITAVLNSTLVALIKCFYGRYAGTEGNLKTEVIDVLALEIPNPRFANPKIVARLASALESMQARESTELLEARFRQCHSASDLRLVAGIPLELPSELQQADRRALDDSVFALLGVTDQERRATLIDRLYHEITLHNRNIRIVEVQKMEQRRKTGTDRVSQIELALDAWIHLDAAWQLPLTAWLSDKSVIPKITNLPDGEIRLPAPENFFEATTLFFGKKPGQAYECSSRAEAELLYRIAHEGLRGSFSIPSEEAQCRKLLADLEYRLEEGRRKISILAEERAGTEKLREQVVEILNRWFIHGQPELASARKTSA